MKQNKKKRPISRNFWSYLRFLPKWIRAPIIRSKFELDYNLPDELVLKQAETVDEIQQALSLVHDSYVELGYIKPNDNRLRFSKYLALPTTVILIAKWKDEVIGTMSIISDSAFGLPIDAACSIQKLRSDGKIIAEISSLTIKQNFRMRRGKLFLPLCKIMYLYCTKILKIDYIVASTSAEVEAFYTDILMFKLLEQDIEHPLVNNNPSTCQYLHFGDHLVEEYKQVYNSKPKRNNLYYFFCEAKTKQIQLPDPKYSIQSYLNNKNISINNLIEKHNSLLESFNHEDLRVLQNLDPNRSLFFTQSTHVEFEKKRYDTRGKAVFFLKDVTQSVPCQILNISTTGIQLLMSAPNQHEIHFNQKILIVCEFKNTLVSCEAVIVWTNKNQRIGCRVTNSTQAWVEMTDLIQSEIEEFKNKVHYLKKVN